MNKINKRGVVSKYNTMHDISFFKLQVKAPNVKWNLVLRKVFFQRRPFEKNFQTPYAKFIRLNNTRELEKYHLNEYIISLCM